MYSDTLLNLDGPFLLDHFFLLFHSMQPDQLLMLGSEELRCVDERSCLYRSEG
jgi:hypothetical protein